MTVRHLNPDSLARPDGFVHVAIGTGTRLISVAGQVGIDERGRLAGADDLAAQTEQALLNVHAALTAASATFTDVIKLTIYVVDWHESKLPQLIDASQRVERRTGDTLMTTSTLVPVVRGYRQDYLVEVDALAVVQD
jgi:enamine deaminase RidA (YjgF/YER057c/UK114 family)